MKRSVLRVGGMGIASNLLLIAACSSSTKGTSDGGVSSGTPRVDGSTSQSSSVENSSGSDAATPTEKDGAPIYVDAGPPALQFIGRFDTRDPSGPKCGWPGCRVLARFEGTSVSAQLNEIDETWMADGAPSEWDVAVDDVWKDKIVTTPGTKTYPIASGLTAGAHKVELYKRTETQNGVTQFLSFDFGGGKLLEPPLKSTRKLEIVGDSAAAGFGIEGIGYPQNDCPGMDYSAKWQNFRKSFGSLLGNTLDAELHGTIYSGKGMVKDIWRPDPDTMPVIFPLANPVDHTSTYDFAWKPDVVIVMMGGNDFSEGQPDESNGNGPATPTEFTDTYRTFVTNLRDHYPAAHIFLSVSPSVGDVDPPGRYPRTTITNTTTTITKEHNDANDLKVYAFSPTVATPDELTACNGHGTPAFHTRVAAEFATVVKQKTGW